MAQPFPVPLSIKAWGASTEIPLAEALIRATIEPLSDAADTMAASWAFTGSAMTDNTTPIR